MSLDTPVAFIIFNRPDFTQIVFNSIRQAQPKQLLVVADGQHLDRPEDAVKCEAARAIINQVDWDCEVLTNYSDINLGCKKRVSSGLDWVFSQVDEAIILEDDCLPAPSFFNFCQLLLEHYRHDERVMVISGNNFQGGQTRTPYSYYFSKYPHIWGWASWSRAWKYHDITMTNWLKYKELGLINTFSENIYEQQYWSRIFDDVASDKINSWAYAWTFDCWSQSGLTILPQSNLVSNIGFRADGTHTVEDSPTANLPVNDIWEIYHPPFVVRHKEADAYTFDHVFGGKAIREARSLVSRLRSYIPRVKQSISKLTWSSCKSY